MRRREFIAFVGSAAAMCPLAARAQAQPPKQLIGFLSSASPISYTRMVATFQDGLNQTGFDDHNVVIEFHWAEGDYDLLPWFAASLVTHKVAAIIAGAAPQHWQLRVRLQRYRSSFRQEPTRSSWGSLTI